MESLNLKRGDKVYFFHPEDPDCWTTERDKRKIIECTVNSYSVNSDPVFGCCYGVIEKGKSDPVFIYDRFFETASFGAPSCYLSRAEAEQAIIDAGYIVGG